MLTSIQNKWTVVSWRSRPHLFCTLPTNALHFHRSYISPHIPDGTLPAQSCGCVHRKVGVEWDWEDDPSSLIFKGLLTDWLLEHYEYSINEWLQVESKAQGPNLCLQNILLFWRQTEQLFGKITVNNKPKDSDVLVMLEFLLLAVGRVISINYPDVEHSGFVAFPRVFIDGSCR